jgi:hypothetical protein
MRTAVASRSRSAWQDIRTQRPPASTTGATMTLAWEKSNGSEFEIEHEYCDYCCDCGLAVDHRGRDHWGCYHLCSRN